MPPESWCGYSRARWAGSGIRTSRSMSTADNRLASYLRSLPEAKRWVRRPYYNNERVLQKLDDGSTGAALVWEPALYFATEGDPEAAGYRQLPLPFQEQGIIVEIDEDNVRAFAPQRLIDFSTPAP